MLIPNKFSGYSFDGSRRCFGGGGGGGGGDGSDGTGTGGGNDGVGSGPGVGGDAGGGNTANTSINTNTGNTGNTTFNTNRGSVTGMNFTGSGNTAGTSTIPRDNLNLQNMYGKPYNQSGQQYNALLQQGFTGNDIRNALTTNGKPVSDSDYGYLVQDAGMKSPTSRPYAGSDQFFQPVYNSQYQNYARPYSQFDTSTYGTQPMNSPLLNQTSRSNVNNKITDFYNTNYRDNPNGVGMGDTLDFMRQNGINRNDFQTYGGVNNYGPQMSMPSMQTQAQQPFNPYSNNFGFNGQLMTAGYGGFGSPMGGLSPFVTNPMYQMPQPYNPFSSQQSSYRPQMQTPFSFQQPSYQQQSYQPQPQPLTSSMQGQQQPTQQMMSNFQNARQSSQAVPQQIQPQQSYSGQEALNMGLGNFGSQQNYGGGFMPQMQSPFNYQQQSYQPSYQPSYGGYDTYGDDFGGGVNMRTPVTQQPTQPVAPRSSGPTTPIVGRSSGFRGTPNVMRRAEGGIASLMDDVE